MATQKAQKTVFSAYVEDAKDVECLKAVLATMKLGKTEVFQGGVADAYKAYLDHSAPEFLLVDISNSDLPVSDLSRLLDVCSPDVKVVALGAKNDVGLYRDLMKLGVVEYIVSPLFPELLTNTLKKLIHGDEKEEHEHKVGKTISFLGARGGVGSTFIATNFASILSKEKARRVVLVDLDLYYGTVCLYYNVKSNGGLAEALENPGRIDAVYMEQVLLPINDRLSVLSADLKLSDELEFNSEGFNNLLDYLAQYFHYVLIDLPHCESKLITAALLKSDVSILTSEPSLQGLRDTRNILKYIQQNSSKANILTVLNKVGLYPKDEVTNDDFEKAIDRKVTQVIAFEQKGPLEFINTGQTLSKKDIPLAKAIENLVDNILGVRSEAPKSKGWFGFLKD